MDRIVRRRTQRLAATLAVTCVSLAGCNSDAEDAAKDAECSELAADVNDAVVLSVEQLIWERKLYKTDRRIPKVLLRSGDRIPILEMTEKQRDLYDYWKRDNRAYERSTETKFREAEETALALKVKSRCLDDQQ